MAQSPTTAEIEQLLDLLASGGFRLSTHQALAVETLLETLRQNGQWPEARGYWRTLLTPLIATTADEQRAVYRAFDRWELEHRGAPVIAAEAATEVPRGRKPLLSRRVMAGVGMVVALGILVASGYSAWQRWALPALPARPAAPGPPPKKCAGCVELSSIRAMVSDSTGRPIHGAIFWYLGKSSYTNAGGEANLLAPPRAEFRYVVSHNEYTAVLGKHSGRGAVRVAMHRKVAEPPLEQKAQDEQELKKTRDRWLQWLLDYRVPIAFLPLTILLLHWLIVEIRAFQLRRWTTPVELRQVRAGLDSTGELFSPVTMKKLAQELRRRRPVPTEELAVEPTISATVKRGGLFTPAYAERHVTPEYLALLPRASGADQQAALYDTLLQQFSAHVVLIDRYFYRTDPRTCTKPEDGAAVTLDHLAGLHPHHELWLFGESSQFVNPLTREPLAWVQGLSKWQDRVVLSPISNDLAPEFGLADLGFRLTAPSSEGIARLTSAVMDQPRPAEEEALYPPALQVAVEQWLTDVMPSPRKVFEAMGQLHRYLGPDGFLLLSACAVYPALAWPLTRELAVRIAPGESREAVLCRLVRLPWFRFGRMPDWLRARLVNGLSPAESQTIRKALQEVLGRLRAGAERGLESDAGFAFARRTWASRVRHWRGRREEDGRRPDRDYVFLSFLWGRQPDPLSVVAPSLLKRLLFRQGQALFGIRRGVRLAAAALLTLVGYWAAPAMERMLGPQPIGPESIVVIAPDDSRPTLYAGRVLDVAAVQVGRLVSPEQVKAGFVPWCFEVAAEVMGNKPPEMRAVLVGGKPTADNFISAGEVRTKPSLLKPGFVFLTDDGGIRSGIVETVRGDRFVGIEVVAVEVRRVTRRISDVGIGFLDFSKVIVRVNPRDGLEYVWIPPGRFMMGCSPGDKECRANELPAHEVEITKGFWIGRTEVTQAAFEKVRGTNPSAFEGADRPVEQVSWDDAGAYCRAVGLRLPTEAEWEYAARAGSTEARYGPVDQIAWYRANSGGQTHPVAKRTPNQWGLYDMLGNVHERVGDWYDPDYYAKMVRQDAVGPPSGESRVVRGASWYDNPENVRVSNRFRNEPTYRLSVIGIRCAGEFR